MTIIGNWKSNKNNEEARQFLEEFAGILFEKPQDQHKIILAPSYSCLKYATEFVRANDLKIAIAAQDVSDKEEGAFTGQVAASQLQNIAEYVIIGHSERRRLYGETEEVVAKKVTLAKKAGLKVILCLQNEDEKSEDVEYIAFEPPSAIGSGKPDNPENVKRVLAAVKKKNENAKLLYGGSVTKDNMHMYAKIPNLEGFLIGGASLEAASFAAPISKC